MKLLIGLGNPGKEYANTRHNVGFIVLDRLSTKFEALRSRAQGRGTRNSKQAQNSKFKYQKKFESELVQIGDVLLAKPLTFMNRSGEAVKKLMASGKWRVEDLYVIHDDLDIPLGKYKIQLGRGPKEHRGVISIEHELARNNFWRVRIGVDNRDGITRTKMSGDEYVLSRFPKQEREIVDKVIEEIRDSLWEVLNR